MRGILPSRSPGPFEEQNLEEKRQGEGCELEEESWEDEDETEDEDEDEDEDFSSQDSFDEDDDYEDYSENEDRFAGDGGPYVFSVTTNDAIDELTKSFSYADILSPDQVRTRIEGLIKILNVETNASEDFVRVSSVMKICNDILMDENRHAPEGITRCELYYKLRRDSRGHFSSLLQVNRTIRDVVALLRCSTYSLGIEEDKRGQVAGRILIQEPNKRAVDCLARRYEISSDLKLLESLVMKTNARCIIVVEKRVIFEIMAFSRAFNERIPSVLLTSSGYPNTATRFLLHRMSQAFPHLPILALVDWKPASLAALSAYNVGSIGMGLEAYGRGTFLQLRQFAPEADGYACNVKWLGLRWDDLNQLDDLRLDRFLLPLNRRDLQIAESLISSKILQGNDRKELEAMIKIGRKAEIEAMCYRGNKAFLKYIANKIEQAGYI